MVELQAGIKIGRRSINNLRYVDDVILMAESEEELKSLLMKEESEIAGLKLNVTKKKKVRSWLPNHGVGLLQVVVGLPLLHGKKKGERWK